MDMKDRIDRSEAEKIKARVVQAYKKKLEEWTLLPKQDAGTGQQIRRFKDQLDEDIRHTFNLVTGLPLPFMKIATVFLMLLGVALPIILLSLFTNIVDSVWFWVLVVLTLAAEAGIIIWLMRGNLERFLAFQYIFEQLQMASKRVREINRRLEESYGRLERIEPLLGLLPTIDAIQIRETTGIPENKVEIIRMGGKSFAMIRRRDDKHLLLALDQYIHNTPIMPELSPVIEEYPYLRDAIELTILEALLREAGLEKQLGGKYEGEKRQAFTDTMVQNSYLGLKDISDKLKMSGKSVRGFGLENMTTLLQELGKSSRDASIAG